jgi:septal ring factor EnvC (AmiA/AmiB activator)
MEEGIKSRIILILSILCLILLISNISSCSNGFRQKAARDKEMFSRLDLEEKMGKFGQEKAALLKQIEEEKVAVEAMKKDLVQEQSLNQALKEELEKMTKLKETLEENLKEALVKKKK